MASLYERGNLIWIKYRDPKTGKILQESTGLHAPVSDQTSARPKFFAQRNPSLRPRHPQLTATSASPTGCPTTLDIRYANSPENAGAL
jgi:hypothetical protein